MTDDIAPHVAAAHAARMLEIERRQTHLEGLRLNGYSKHARALLKSDLPWLLSEVRRYQTRDEVLQGAYATACRHREEAQERARNLETMLRRQGHDEGAEFSADLRVLTWYSTDWVHSADVAAVVNERDALREQVRTLSGRSEHSAVEVRTLQEQVRTLQAHAADQSECRESGIAIREALRVERDGLLEQVKTLRNALAWEVEAKDRAFALARKLEGERDEALKQSRLLAARGAEWATRAKAAEARVADLEDPPERPKKCRSTFAFGRGSVRCQKDQGHDGRHSFLHIDGPIEWNRRGGPDGK